MRTRAPAVHEWVARMWNLNLHDFNEVPFENNVQTHLHPLLSIVCKEFIPYMQLNETAVTNNKKYFEFKSQGVVFKLPAQRYRAWRFQRLKTRYQALQQQTQSALDQACPDLPTLLALPVTCPIESRIDALPITTPKRMKSRAW